MTDKWESNTESGLANFIRKKGIQSWNIRQNAIGLLAIIIVSLLFIFPPWQATAPNGISGAAGHYFIFSSAPTKEWKFPSLDFVRLFLQIGCVSFISGVLIFLLRTVEDTN